MSRSEFSKPVKRERAKVGAAKQWIQDALASDTDECILWPYALLRNGYGQANHFGKAARVHRLVCISAHGHAPTEKHEAAHNCGNRACANPRHIRWATPKQNHADQILHGTTNRGSRNGHAKLTAGIVAAARASTLSIAELARRHGVSNATMADAVRRRTWAWL